MPKKTRYVEDLPLFPKLPPAQDITDIPASWETNGIFSDHFIRTRLKDIKELWPEEEFVKTLYDDISARWKKKYLGLAKGNEEVTKREFLEPILERLGFSFLSGQKLPDQRQVPDYLIFQDEDAKEAIFDAEITDQYRGAVTLLEAKKVNHPLDAVSKRETPGRFPHQQVRDYLSMAADELGTPFFRWAILTNGGVWRLYNRDSRPSAYFEFRLAGQYGFCSYEDFKVFIALFRPEAFILREGLCPLDTVRAEAIQYQTALEEDLRRRAFSVIEDLANGFWSYKENGIKETDLPEVYDNCLIFLYRLLFVLYAESRELLPVRLSGAGSNKEYRIRYSLQRLVGKLKHVGDFRSDEFTELYEQLLGLFHLINGDQPSRNKACGVPQYNGGLFDPRRYPYLEKWRIGEKSLAKVLRDLIYSSGPSQRGGQQEFEWGTIDYKDLEVRQLGDVYEGLLGGSLEIRGNQLSLSEEYKKRQSTGTFYTPDYIVRYLGEETILPLTKRIEESEEVKRAVAKGLRDNSFADAVLKLNILDPAMGSGHFLVRATEWFADKIVEHPTTRFQIETVSPGLSQEQAEISYWRRRVVEACIYGIDYNPLAVELSKLSLWLTCIASSEPLSFLDHHLIAGNSLIGARLDSMATLPSKKDTSQIPISFGPDLKKAVADAIQRIEAIETEASSTIEIVKKKENLWRKEVMERLKPFKTIGDLWIATLAGLKLDEFLYHKVSAYLISPQKSKGVKEEWSKLEAQLSKLSEEVKPFHWELEFPDVFFAGDGAKLENPGFDAILGNPPYISTQSSSGFAYRDGLEYLFGFADDLYVHFVFQGFNLLRDGGMFGFIISDTFFTLSTKQRLRDLFQSNRLTHLGQCDPFRATVDAAVFVAEKTHPHPNPLPDGEGTGRKSFAQRARENVDSPPLTGGDEGEGGLLFIQARYETATSKAGTEILNLIKGTPEFKKGEASFKYDGKEYPVYHAQQGCLRLHKTNIEPYKKALKNAFFEPTDAIVRLYNRFMEPMNRLVDRWWKAIETSKKFAQNKTAILEYHKTLKPGDVTLVGLIAEGGQGLSTGNNGRFLGYLQGTEQAKKIIERRKELTSQWLNHVKIGTAFKKLSEEGLDFGDIVDVLKEQFNQYNELGLKRGEIYRIVEQRQIADITNIDDTMRQKIIYEGLEGETWLPFKKSDPEGNKWLSEELLFINWSKEHVEWFFKNSGRSAPNMPVVRNPEQYLTPGITWTPTANHVCIKTRLQPTCIFEADGVRLTPFGNTISPLAFLALMNSDLFSFIMKKFINNTAKCQVNVLRQMPLIIPTKSQAAELETLAKSAVEAKGLSLKDEQPSKGLLAFCKELAENQKVAPEYLRPPKQLKLIESADDCLNIIELAVHWVVERLYGVEGHGPFNEF